MANRDKGKNVSPPTSRSRKKQALGRGLDALIPDMSNLNAPSEETVSDALFQCDIDLIQPNPFQPRLNFSENELFQLAESIKSQGILQPLLVRTADRGYEMVAGERRLRAARLAGLDTVPVMVKDLSNAKMLEISIVENIQRENLNPIEEAEGYHRLITEFKLTQEEAAEEDKTLDAYDLNALEQKLYDILTDEPMQINTICAKSELDPSTVLVYLLSLEFKGLVYQMAGKQFYRA